MKPRKSEFALGKTCLHCALIIPVLKFCKKTVNVQSRNKIDKREAFMRINRRRTKPASWRNFWSICDDLLNFSVATTVKQQISKYKTNSIGNPKRVIGKKVWLIREAFVMKFWFEISDSKENKTEYFLKRLNKNVFYKQQFDSKSNRH